MQERLLMEDKTHFLHQAREEGKDKRTKAREAKKEIFNDLTKTTSDAGHVWILKGKSVQCQHCKKRLTLHSKVEDLRTGQTEACPMANTPPLIILQQMVQGNMPDMANHAFELRTNYVVCGRCNQRLLKHSAKEKIVELAKSPCWDEAWQPGPAWMGYPSHQM